MGSSAGIFLLTPQADSLFSPRFCYFLPRSRGLSPPGALGKGGWTLGYLQLPLTGFFQGATVGVFYADPPGTVKPAGCVSPLSFSATPGIFQDSVPATLTEVSSVTRAPAPWCVLEWHLTIRSGWKPQEGASGIFLMTLSYGHRLVF